MQVLRFTIRRLLLTVPVLLGVATLVFSLLVVLVYMLTDIAHALLDPRVRFE